MSELEANLETILPEVHAIFTEKAAEKDLSAIKRVKKICADTKQIVENREQEIKEVVRALQQRVEREEEIAENDESVSASVAAIQHKDEEKKDLLRQIENINQEKENSKAQIQKVKADVDQVKQRQQESSKLAGSEIPRNKGLLALYLNITNIRWDAAESSGRISGIVIPSENDADTTPRAVDMDPAGMSEVQLCNAIWDLID
eukprot:CAMPEP_0177708872 /NCGR_PEP_ID=MMETSP0484_2-20121128/10503_1 /TAXON_ID=354590 /ORGANISM="Rhodomonas lens, Strain RHODO" /LENGTH=202 /DNA_ID=CAMNT_0019220455 /DNA_START=126 /DNA_END=734 /DNA_ORIENTATION=+